jgi:hypothetical protein
MMTDTTRTVRLLQHDLVILRRLRRGPLTEFELSAEIGASSGYSADEAADRVGPWLEDLQARGLVWSGKLYNDRGQSIYAAALTRAGRELIG